MTDDELVDRLTEYPQVGEQRAAEIIDLVREFAPGVDVEAARESLEEALVQLDRKGGAVREAFIRDHVQAALEALEAADV